MNKIATGLVVGGLLGMAGAGYMASTNTTKKKIMRKGKKVMNKAEHALDDISSDMW